MRMLLRGCQTLSTARTVRGFDDKMPDSIHKRPSISNRQCPEASDSMTRCERGRIGANRQDAEAATSKRGNSDSAAHGR